MKRTAFLISFVASFLLISAGCDFLSKRPAYKTAKAFTDQQFVSIGYHAVSSNSAVAVGTAANAGGEGVSVGFGSEAYTNGASLGFNADSYSNGVAVGYGSRGIKNGVGVGYEAVGSESGVAVGYNAQGGNHGAAVGWGALGNDSGAAVGYGAAGYSWGAAVGIEAQAISSGAALGAVALARDGSVSLGSFSASDAEGVAIGPLAIMSGGDGIAIGSNVAALRSSIAIGTLSRSVEGGIAIGNRALAGSQNSSEIIKDSVFSDARGRPEWAKFVQTVTITGFPAGNDRPDGDFYLRSYGGDMLSAYFENSELSFHIASGEAIVSRGEVEYHTTVYGDWGMVLDQLAQGTNVWVDVLAETQTPVTGVVVASVAFDADPTAFGAVSIGDSSYASGARSLALGTEARAAEAGSIAIGSGAYNDVQNTALINTEKLTVEDQSRLGPSAVVTDKFMFPDGTYLTKKGTNLIYVYTVNSNPTTNRVSLSAAP